MTTLWLPPETHKRFTALKDDEFGENTAAHLAHHAFLTELMDEYEAQESE